MRIAVEGVRADLWCRTCESVVPGRSRSTTARDLPANDCSRVSSGVDSEVESRPASADFESLTLRSRVDISVRCDLFRQLKVLWRRAAVGPRRTMRGGMTRGTPVALGARRSSRRPHSNAVSATTWRGVGGGDGALLGGLGGPAQSMRNRRRWSRVVGVPGREADVEQRREVAGAREARRRRERSARESRARAAARVLLGNIMACERGAGRRSRATRTTCDRD